MKLLRLFCYSFILIVVPVHAAQQTNNSEHSIVCIESSLSNGETLIGTGFFIAPGIIATVQHQIKNATTIIIHGNNKNTDKATLVTEAYGLALLRVPNKTTAYLLLTDNLPEINTHVFTSGCQLNKQLSVPQLVPFLQGSISDPRRSGTSGTELIEAKLPIKKGHSGGPLLLDDQHVVGIINGYDEKENELSVSIPAQVLIQLMAEQQVIEFAPEITALWQKAQESHDTTEQLGIYNEILSKTPWHTEAHYNQGMLYFSLHDYLNAKKQFLLAVQQRPNFYNAYIYLGSTFSALKDHSAARNSLIQAMLIDINNPIAYSLIAGIYQNGLADTFSERNALQRYIHLETTKSKADIAQHRLQEIEQLLKP